MAQQYLIGTKELGESALARVGAKDSIDRYAELIDLVKTRCGPETASIFAEPVRGLNRASGIATVTWFGALEGTPLPFPQLDATALRSVADLLRQRLKSFATLFSDPTHGPTFASWLYVLSPSDILSIAGQPVIINWGMVPAAVATSEEGREANFRRTMEPYAPRIPLPPFTLDEAQSFAARLKQFELSESSLASRANLSGPPTSGPVAAATAAAAAREAAAASAAPGAAPRRRSWVAPAIAVVIAAALLAVIELFHLLVYPDPAAPLDEQIELQRTTNEALRERLHQLQSAVTNKVCQYVPGQLQPTNGQDFKELLPPQPQQTKVEVPGEPQTTTSSMADLLDKATVIVLAGDTLGSGFFISPTDIVTNHHVAGDLQQVKVANKLLEGWHLAKVIATGHGRTRGTQDLAVLRIEPTPKTEFLRVGVVPERLRPVFASGFPSAVLATIDRNSSERLPEANITAGMVASRQNQQPDGIGTIIHTAQIGHGNSGGPLTDQGGCVVGVNSWLAFDANENRNFQTYDQALDAAELRKFLEENGIQYTAAPGECPAIAQVANNPPANNPPAPPSPQPQPPRPANEK